MIDSYIALCFHRYFLGTTCKRSLDWYKRGDTITYKMRHNKEAEFDLYFTFKKIADYNDNESDYDFNRIISWSNELH